MFCGAVDTVTGACWSAAASLTVESLALYSLKGALRRFVEEIQTQNFDAYNINEAIIQPQTFFLYLN